MTETANNSVSSGETQTELRCCQIMEKEEVWFLKGGGAQLHGFLVALTPPWPGGIISLIHSMQLPLSHSARQIWIQPYRLCDMETETFTTLFHILNACAV